MTLTIDVHEIAPYETRNSPALFRSMLCKFSFTLQNCFCISSMRKDWFTHLSLSVLFYNDLWLFPVMILKIWKICHIIRFLCREQCESSVRYIGTSSVPSYAEMNALSDDMKYEHIRVVFRPQFAFKVRKPIETRNSPGLEKNISKFLSLTNWKPFVQSKWNLEHI